MSDTIIRFGSNSGQPVSRLDGVAKVTGAAAFAADHLPEGVLHAVYVPAAIARGRVTHLDVAAAEAHPGWIEMSNYYDPARLEGVTAYRLRRVKDFN